MTEHNINAGADKESITQASNVRSVLAVEVPPRAGCKLHTHTTDFITAMESQLVPIFRQSRSRVPPSYFCGRGTLRPLLDRCLRAFFSFLLSVFLPFFFLFLSCFLLRWPGGGDFGLGLWRWRCWWDDQLAGRRAPN